MHPYNVINHMGTLRPHSGYQLAKYPFSLCLELCTYDAHLTCGPPARGQDGDLVIEFRREPAWKLCTKGLARTWRPVPPLGLNWSG